MGDSGKDCNCRCLERNVQLCRKCGFTKCGTGCTVEAPGEEIGKLANPKYNSNGLMLSSLEGNPMLSSTNSPWQPIQVVVKREQDAPCSLPPPVLNLVLLIADFFVRINIEDAEATDPVPPAFRSCRFFRRH